MAGVRRQVLYSHARSDTTRIPTAVDRRDYHVSRMELPHEFQCSHLVHYTENDFAANIGLSNTSEFIFQPRRIQIDKPYPFSWWSPLPPDDWKTEIECNLPNVDTRYFDIGNSPALNGDSLCGPIGIVVKWHDILSEYARSRGSIVTDVELRVLGTFRYSKEIMFGILVCMKGDADVTGFPLIDANGTEAFVPCSREHFIWKVYSTVGYSGVRPYGVFWSWDHISFGFYCPGSNLNIRDQFCGFKTKKATPYRPMSRPDTIRRSIAEMKADEGILDRLVRKVSVASR